MIQIDEKVVEIGARAIDPDAFREYDAAFAARPAGVTYTMMALYPRIARARAQSRACLSAALFAMIPNEGNA